MWIFFRMFVEENKNNKVENGWAVKILHHCYFKLHKPYISYKGEKRSEC